MKKSIAPSLNLKLSLILCHHSETDSVHPQECAREDPVPSQQTPALLDVLKFNSPWSTCEILVFNLYQFFMTNMYKANLLKQNKTKHCSVTNFLTNDPFASSSGMCTEMTGGTIF